MSKPIYIGANVSPQNHTFAQWMTKTNQVIYDMSTSVVTVSSVAQPNTINGATTVGNAHIEGIFSANTISVASQLRGGTVSVPADLVITSNVNFSNSATITISNNTSSLVVGANTTTFNGNVVVSNTSKTVSITAANTNIESGTFYVKSNTVFSGIDVDILTTNLDITSNTTLTNATTNINARNVVIGNSATDTANVNAVTTFNSNVSISGIISASANVTFSGALVNISSTNTTIGDASTDVVNINAKHGKDIIAISNTINIGNSTNYFANVYVTNAVIGADVDISGSLDLIGSTDRNIVLKSANSTNTRGLFTLNNTLTANVTPLIISEAGLFSGANVTFDIGSATNSWKTIHTKDLNVYANANITGNFYTNSVANVATLTVRDLVATRLPYMGTGGLMVSSANMTYNGTRLNVIGAASTSNSTGALTVTGGFGVTGAAYIGGATAVQNTLSVTGAATLSSSLTTTLFANVATLNARNLAPTRIPYIAANNTLIDSANLTYIANTINGDTLKIIGATSTNTTTGALTITGGVGVSGNSFVGGNINIGGVVSATGEITSVGQANVSSITARDLTISRIPIVAIGGKLADNANLTFNGTSVLLTGPDTIDAVTGALRITGGAYVSNTLRVGGNTSVAGNLVVIGNESITGISNAASVTARNLVSGRMTYAGTGGALVDSANLTFSGTVLNVNTGVASTTTTTGAVVVTGGVGISGSAFIGGNASIGGNISITGNETITGISNSASITARNLTLNRVTYAGAGGSLIDSANLVFTGTTLGVTGVDSSSTLTGAVVVTGGLGVSGNVFTGNITSSNLVATNIKTSGLVDIANDVEGLVKTTSTSNTLYSPLVFDLTNTTNTVHNPLIVKTTGVEAGANLTYDIGSATAYWKTGYLNELNAANSVNIVSAANTNTLRVRALTATRVSYTGTAGVFQDSANLTFSGTKLAVIGDASTSTTTGAITITGGIGVSGNAFVGGTLNATGIITGSSNLNLTGYANASTVYSRNLTAGRLTYGAAAGQLVDNANLTFNGTTLKVNTNITSSTTDAGALVVVGAVGISQNLNVGGASRLNSISAETSIDVGSYAAVGTYLTVAGLANTGTSRVRSLTETRLPIAGVGGLLIDSINLRYVANTLNGDTLFVTGANSSSNTTGAIVVTGGVGVSENITIGKNAVVQGDLTVLGTAFLSSNTALSLNESVIEDLTVTSTITLSGPTTITGNIVPINNSYSVGSATNTWNNVYANNLVGNLAWSNVTSKPSPILTLAGKVTGSATFTELGSTTLTTTIPEANVTTSGIVGIGAQSFAGVKTFTSTINANVNGNALTSDTLKTARTFNGVSFDGSASIVVPTNVTIVANTVVDHLKVSFVNDAGAIVDGNYGVGVSSAFTYQPSTGTVTSIDYNSSSDRRLKKNIVQISNALEKVEKLVGVYYDRVDTDRHYMGLIAQEVEEIAPELVNTDDSTGYKYVSYGNAVGLLVEAIKDISEQIKVLNDKIDKIS